MDFLVSIILGVLFILIGVSNSSGNISSLHSYHRWKVAEEDKKPLGQKIGLSMYIIGVALILYGILAFCSDYFKLAFLTVIGALFLITGIISGLCLMLYSIIKYNKGLF